MALTLRWFADAEVVAAPSFDAVYDEHAPFVWRTLRRLGIKGAGTDDALQDVFLVVHRKLPAFRPQSPGALRSWLYSIAVRVSRDHRRTLRRKGTCEVLDETWASTAPTPIETSERAEAARILDRILDGLDDDKRETFVLIEISQLTAPEVAEVLGVKLNTVYSRLRAARAYVEQAVSSFGGGS